MRPHIWYTVTYVPEDAPEFKYPCEHFRERVDADMKFDDFCEQALREATDRGVPINVQLFEQDDRFGSLIPKRQKYFE